MGQNEAHSQGPLSNETRARRSPTHGESHSQFHERTLLEPFTERLHSSSKTHNPELSWELLDKTEQGNYWMWILQFTESAKDQNRVCR